jgi:hypothetical protein
MTARAPPSFDAEEQAVLDEIGRRLRADGWANHVTAAWLLAAWDKLAASVDGYELTIDDYTNDLMARDGLEWVLGASPPPLHAKLLSWIETADHAFLAGTQDDGDGVLGSFIRIDETSGWWWKRTPRAGPLADSLPHLARA